MHHPVCVLALFSCGVAYSLAAGGERLHPVSQVIITEADINALRALAPPPLRPVPRPSRPQPRTPQPRWSRRHSAHEPPGAPTAPARL